MIFDELDRKKRLEVGKILPQSFVNINLSDLNAKLKIIYSEIWEYLIPKSQINSITRPTTYLDALKDLKPFEWFKRSNTSSNEKSSRVALNKSIIVVDDTWEVDSLKVNWKDSESRKRKQKSLIKHPREIKFLEKTYKRITKDPKVNQKTEIESIIPSWEKIKIPKDILPNYKRPALSCSNESKSTTESIFSFVYEIAYPDRVFKTLNVLKKVEISSKYSNAFQDHEIINSQDYQSVSLSDDSINNTPAGSPKPSPSISPKMSPIQSPKLSLKLRPSHQISEKEPKPNLELESPIAVRADAPKVWGWGNPKHSEPIQSPQFGQYLIEVNEKRKNVLEVIKENDIKENEKMEFTNDKQLDPEIKPVVHCDIENQGKKITPLNNIDPTQINYTEIKHNLNDNQFTNPFLNPSLVKEDQKYLFKFGSNSNSAAPSSQKYPFNPTTQTNNLASEIINQPANSDIDMKDSTLLPKLNMFSSPKIQTAPFDGFLSPAFDSNAVFSSPPFAIPNQSPQFIQTPSFQQSSSYPTSPASSITQPFTAPFNVNSGNGPTTGFVPIIGASSGGSGGFSLGILPGNKKTARARR